MAEKVIYATYDDDDVLKDGAKSLVAEGVKVSNVYSPMPIHGIDPIIGLEETRLGIVAFLFGITGLLISLVGLRFFMITDWPLNIGGKRNFSLVENILSFIPVIFEVTVLCAAHGMAITYLFRNKTLPGMPARNPYPRTTDDRFVIELNVNNNDKHSIDELIELVKKTGIIEFEEKLIK